MFLHPAACSTSPLGCLLGTKDLCSDLPSTCFFYTSENGSSYSGQNLDFSLSCPPSCLPCMQSAQTSEYVSNLHSQLGLEPMAQRSRESHTLRNEPARRTPRIFHIWTTFHYLDCFHSAPSRLFSTLWRAMTFMPRLLSPVLAKTLPCHRRSFSLWYLKWNLHLPHLSPLPPSLSTSC